MKLVLLSIGSALAAFPADTLPSLARACEADYRDHCSEVNKFNLVSVLACGKANEASLQPACVEEIKKDFYALYACTDDLSTYCPSFGQLDPWQWGVENTGKKHHKKDTPKNDTPKNELNPRRPDVPFPQPTMNVTEEKPVVEDYDYGFFWDFDDDDMSDASSTTTAFHSKKKHSSSDDSRECFRTNYAAFSVPCLNAIAEQWTKEKIEQGAQNFTVPTADEAFDMMNLPASSIIDALQKVSQIIFICALAFVAVLLLTCLCCCCCCHHRNKRRSARIVPDEAQELASLPEAIVVPVASPTRYVPVATPVVARPVPYTGAGLSAYVPLAQPAHM